MLEAEGVERSEIDRFDELGVGRRRGHTPGKEAEERERSEEA
jgi:hypothetical protein